MGRRLAALVSEHRQLYWDLSPVFVGTRWDRMSFFPWSKGLEGQSTSPFDTCQGHSLRGLWESNRESVYSGNGKTRDQDKRECREFIVNITRIAGRRTQLKISENTQRAIRQNNKTNKNQKQNRPRELSVQIELSTHLLFPYSRHTPAPEELEIAKNNWVEVSKRKKRRFFPLVVMVVAV